MDGDALGLRERKKAEKRLELSLATIRLVIDNGWNTVSVADIAAAAGVSERTFRNYFSSKAEAVASRHLDRMRRICEELRSRPVGEPLWAALPGAVLAEFELGEGGVAAGPGTGSHWAEGVRRMVAEPAVRGAILEADAVARDELAAVIAERVGADVQRDVYPKLVAAVVSTACSVAAEHAITTETPDSDAVILRDILTMLAAGLP
ncbi:TetR/AcrR family transcriptional regulator [Nocardia donostiensis]|uniref:HTH tetR-type domain-containing protein n=1 Tax=Nocardia donostiensis TaxID=1538463 RepID=A0A1V2TJT0_9NOCA|nr:TetR/AcrR family transcriptional regulator [Nocardia donostiensis]ONM49728.1 hypothetical protein B0T46_04715 [Nocardia donostiensis]OQS15390.1 hypothetical protein B0T36_08860 [Nocardia donostiensis]OQS19821.1 hypothetical protein B0T44_12385 [Nocardia donostiensis]